jgi:lipid-binding SYLF domain-containing protein
LVTCRGVKSWSPPVFLTVSGGSFGFQIGGSSTDLILVFRGRRGLQKLLSDKFKIGGDASAAAGPVGRSASAGTDIELHAEILTYSRSRGAFAGISLSGAVVQPDDTGNQALVRPHCQPGKYPRRKSGHSGRGHGFGTGSQQSNSHARPRQPGPMSRQNA